MVTKLTGAVLIIIGCGGIGFYAAAAHRSKIKSIYEFLRILDQMEAELSCRLTPLPRLCRTAASCSGMYGKVLSRFADSLESQISPDPVSCMEIVVSGCGPLPGCAKECLLALGRSLGIFDLSGQLKQIASLRAEWRHTLEALEENKDVRLRCCQVLGLCAGAALAILFI